jgi:hypothetical protein
MMVHSYNSSYNSSYKGGTGRKMVVQGQPEQKRGQSYLKNNLKQKGLGARFKW